MRPHRAFPLSLVLVAAGCVTESLSVCINCNGFTVARLRGGFTVTLSASRGTVPCDTLHASLAQDVRWDGCLDPQGGTVDSLRGLIRLAFRDSTGLPGAIEFLEVEGSEDSARSAWRTTCAKTAPGPACPVGTGMARWIRTPATP